MSLKRFQELNENLLLSAFTLNDIWVFVGFVRIFDIVNFEEATSILIDLAESLLNKLQSAGIEFSTNGIKELIDVQCAIVISVERVEKCGNVFFGDTGLKVATSLGKLLLG